MVSYKSDGTPNGTIKSTTTVLANYGGKIANVTINSISEITGCTISSKDAVVTLGALPNGTDVKNFNFTINATGSYEDENGTTHTDTANLTYTVKKWFGEPATVTVHLSNDSTPVSTNSEGNYPEAIIRTATLTASSGTNPVTIADVECKSDDENISVDFEGDQLTITVGTGAS